MINCSGQVRLINLDQLSPLCRTSLTRELDLARAKIDTGSRKEIRISTSSGVLQNIFSASMLLRCFLCTNPCNSNFALLHNAKHLLSIVLVEDLSLNLNFITWYPKFGPIELQVLDLVFVIDPKELKMKRSNIRNIWGQCGQAVQRDSLGTPNISYV